MFKERKHRSTRASAAADKPGLVEQAMLQRDIDLEAAIAALRHATEDTFEAVQSLMHVAYCVPAQAPGPRPRKEAVANANASAFSAPQRSRNGQPVTPNATLTVAQQLHQIACQLRMLESSVLRSPAR